MATSRRGGRRVGAGRKPDPTSERSEKRAAAAEKAAADEAKKAAAAKKKAAAPKPTPKSRAGAASAPNVVLGKRFGLLPRAGYTGAPPAWPLAADATADESALWKVMWRTPQAAAWATEPWRWRHVALYVKWSIRTESPDASAATATAALRLADQIGLTPNGLLDNGWEIEEVPGSRIAAQGSSGGGDGGVPAGSTKPAGATAMQQRLVIVRGGAGGGGAD